MKADETQPMSDTTNGDDKNIDVVEEEQEDGRNHRAVVSRTKEFGFLPIPKSKRHDPTLKVHEQFKFTWKMNLILAGAAVRRSQEVPPIAMLKIRRCLSRICTTPR